MAQVTMINPFQNLTCIAAVLVCGIVEAQNPTDIKPVQNGLEQLTSAETPIRENESMAIFGDSITMQGGYITIIEKAIADAETTRAKKIKLHKHGLNGGRVPTVLAGKSPWGKLDGTMEEILNRDKPTVVVIYLGINDVWHGKKGTSKTDFESGLKKMVAMCKKTGATTVLCTPSVIGEETRDNALNATLADYSATIRKLATTENLTLCDLHQEFIDKLKKINPDSKHQGNLTYDGVHMNAKGNALLADQIAAALARAIKARK